MKFVIKIDPMASPRPRFNRHTGRTYMPTEYMNWKKQLLLAWSLYQADKMAKGKPLFVKIGFYLMPPQDISKVKKNAAALEAEVMPVVKKPDIDNLQKSVLDAINGYAWHDDNQISDIYAKKRYSFYPRVEIEIEVLEWAVA